MSYDYIDEALIWIHVEAHYDVNFTFAITSEGDIIGNAVATQSVSVEPLIPIWCIQNIDAPTTLNLIVDGIASLSCLMMELPSYPRQPFYTFEEYCCAPECMPPDIQFRDGTKSLMLGYFPEDTFTLTEGTQTGSFEIFLSWVTYTITLDRISS